MSGELGFIVMGNKLRWDVEDAVGGVKQMYAVLGEDRDDLERRLLWRKDKPHASDKEALTPLVDDSEGVGLELKAALAQIIESWHA